MDLCTALYRIGSYLKHHLTARHTGGHGVHSPYLFEWVRMILHDKNAYYAWEKIEAIREQMLHNEWKVAFVDYGSAARGLGSSDERRVCDIARGSLAKKKYAQMLARLVGWMSASRWAVGDGQLAMGKGLNVVELGTSLGITTAYLAAMDSRNKIITCDGCDAVVKIAQENWNALGIKNIACKVGELTADSLRLIVNGLQGSVDVAFIDANHTYIGTRTYFNVLADKVHEKSVIVVDDIHYNQDMEKAWEEICADERVTSTMDLYQMGLVFFDKHYWKRNYKIRL